MYNIALNNNIITHVWKLENIPIEVTRSNTKTQQRHEHIHNTHHTDPSYITNNITQSHHNMALKATTLQKQHYTTYIVFNHSFECGLIYYYFDILKIHTFYLKYSL